MSVRTHFKNHGAIHAFWVIAILIAIVSALLLLVPNGVLIRDYISFASAVASIILAVIAIFYSMFTNQSFSEMVGSLNNSVRQTAKSATAIEGVSDRLVSSVDEMSKSLLDLGPRFDAIDTKIEKAWSPERQKSVKLSQPSDKAIGNSAFRNGGLESALYGLYKSYKDQIPFQPLIAFDNDIWRYHVAGCITMLSFLQPKGITIEKKDKSAYLMTSTGEISDKEFESIIGVDKMNEKNKLTIDSFFENNA